MKYAVFLAAAALVSLPANGVSAEIKRIEKGALILENVPETPPALRERLRQYQNTRSAGFGGFVAGGDGIIVATRFGETDQAHHVAAPGAARRQLTFFDEPVRAIATSPANPDLFVFARDTGGDEDYQIFLFDRSDGSAAMVSDGKGRKEFPAWSKDGARIAWATTLEGSQYGIIVAEAAAPDKRRMVFSGEGYWTPGAWSPDGGTLLLYKYVTMNESEIALLDIESGKTTPLSPPGKRIAYGDFAFSADGESLYFTSDEDGEFLDLYRYDIAGGEKANLTKDIDWDVNEIAFSSDGDAYAFTVNEAGRSTLHLRRTRDGRALAAPELPAGVIYGLGFSSDGARLGFTVNATDTPGDVFVWTLGQKSGALERWTAGEIGGLDAATFVEPEFFDYPTFDQSGGAPRRIPAFIYKPEGEGPHPVIISIHGGPAAQSRPYFSSTVQFLAKELGVATILPNVRGSTGSGKTYAALDDGMKREDAVKDIGALLDWIETQPGLDANRVIVEGGSYGGYMVLSSMAHYNDRLAGGIDIVGIANFVTFLENTAEYRRARRRVEFGDESDPEMRAFLESIAPVNRADDIGIPLFVVQGLNDPRVPPSESEQIVKAVRGNGDDVWYMAAKDEGHGFQKKSNIDALTEATALFIERVFGAQQDR